MALITCCKCSKVFSDRAPACPSCGCPTAEAVAPISEPEVASVPESPVQEPVCTPEAEPVSVPEEEVLAQPVVQNDPQPEITLDTPAISEAELANAALRKLTDECKEGLTDGETSRPETVYRLHIEESPVASESEPTSIEAPCADPATTPVSNAPSPKASNSMVTMAIISGIFWSLATLWPVTWFTVVCGLWNLNSATTRFAWSKELQSGQKKLPKLTFKSITTAGSSSTGKMVISLVFNSWFMNFFFWVAVLFDLLILRPCAEKH